MELTQSRRLNAPHDKDIQDSPRDGDAVRDARHAGAVAWVVLGLAPFVGILAFVVVNPRAQAASLVAPIGLLAAVTQCVQRVLGALATSLDDPPYNWLLSTSPFDTPPCDHYHWNIEIFPRLFGIAGFEWGTGCYINTVSSEQAAERLRKTLPTGKAS